MAGKAGRSGRVRGSTNVRRALLLGRLNDLEEDMLKVARREITCGDETREFAAFAVLAPYIFPKRMPVNDKGSSELILRFDKQDEKA